jgi:hypothetical protein
MPEGKRFTVDPDAEGRIYCVCDRHKYLGQISDGSPEYECRACGAKVTVRPSATSLCLSSTDMRVDTAGMSRSDAIGALITANLRGFQNLADLAKMLDQPA